MSSRYGTLPPGQMYTATLAAPTAAAEELAQLRARVRTRRESAPDGTAPIAMPQSTNGRSPNDGGTYGQRTSDPGTYGEPTDDGAIYLAD